MNVAPRVKRLIAQDVGEDMLALVRKNAAERGIANIETLRGNWHAMEPGKDLPVCDVAITRCRRADPIGNLTYQGASGRASHPVIATCGALSIVECDHFCDLGELGPDKIKVPGMFVDMILA